MSAATGRKLVIKRDEEKIGAVVSKSISINNEPIDVTTDDDSGFRTLLPESGVRSIDISVEGVLKRDELVMDAAGNGATLIQPVEIEFPSGMTIGGYFRLNSYDISAETNGRVQFSGTLQSTGEWSVTDANPQ